MDVNKKYWKRTVTVLPPSFVSSWYCNNHQKVHSSPSNKGNIYA